MYTHTPGNPSSISHVRTHTHTHTHTHSLYSKGGGLHPDECDSLGYTFHQSYPQPPFLLSHRPHYNSYTNILTVCCPFIISLPLHPPIALSHTLTLLRNPSNTGRVTFAIYRYCRCPSLNSSHSRTSACACACVCVCACILISAYVRVCVCSCQWRMWMSV